MKKRLLSVLVILSLVLSMFILTACGDDEDYDDDDDRESRRSSSSDGIVVKANSASEKERNEVVTEIVEEKEDLMSEKEAKELLAEYYDIAESLYFLSQDYFDIDMNSDGSEYALKYPISNYEEVINQYISKSFQKKFYPALLEIENGKYYLGIGGFAKGYDNLRFEDIEIEEDKISCTAIIDIYVVDELIGKDEEAKFELVKENGDWKVNDYTSFQELGD